MNHSLPFFSIVVPSYARPVALRNCVGSLLGLNYPRDRFEIIVVHDSLESGSRENLASDLPENIKFSEFFQSNAGPAAARNAGARHAVGNYLAFTDDDCLVAPDWLCMMAEHLHHSPTSACAGSTINYHTGNPYAEASQLINDFVISATDQMTSPFVTSNNLVVPTKAFHAIGGFNTAFPKAAGEDREFSVRWKKSGFSLDHVPEGVILHAHDLDFRSFFRQQFGYGRAAYLLRGLLEQSNGQRVGLERFSFYLDLLRHPFQAGFNRKSVHLSFLIGISQVAVASGFGREALSEPRVSSILQPEAA